MGYRDDGRPEVAAAHAVVPLLNESSNNMNVNGAVANVTFSFTATETCFLYAATILLQDSGTLEFNDFGGASALTNGLLVQQTIGGVNYPMCTIKTNADLAVMFPIGIIPGSGAGFLDTADTYLGRNEFTTPIKLNVGDAFKIVVRDNINIDGLQASVHYWTSV